MNPRWVLGNDVVDLLDPDSRGVLENTAFLDRVYAAAEREVIERAGAGAEAERLVWSLWAAKEAAYKALLPERPDLVWSPRSFIVRMASGSAATGTVQHEHDRLQFEIEHDAAGWLHAFCCGATRATGGVVAAGESALRIERKVALLRPGQDESGAVRELAVGLYQASFQAEAPPRVAGDIPRFERDGRRLELPLSLSHHGRFIAAAFLRPA